MPFKQKLSAGAHEALGSNSTVNQPAPNSPAREGQGIAPVALEKLWRTHGKELLRVTQRITNNREDAEDALQDSFLRAHVHLHSFDGRSSLATWLTRIAINSALMVLRKRKSAPQISNPGIHFLDPVDSTPSAEERYSEREQQAWVRSAIGTLRPSIREALELHALQDNQ
jgi:RNA polymerase sigma factor (sigma-70 family)